MFRVLEYLILKLFSFLEFERKKNISNEIYKIILKDQKSKETYSEITFDDFSSYTWF